LWCNNSNHEIWTKPTFTPQFVPALKVISLQLTSQFVLECVACNYARLKTADAIGCFLLFDKIDKNIFKLLFDKIGKNIFKLRKTLITLSHTNTQAYISTIQIPIS